MRAASLPPCPPRPRSATRGSRPTPQVRQRSGGSRFERIEDVISAAELQAISDRYKKIAGFDRETLKTRPSFV